MTSPDRLRQAASLLRERAEAAREAAGASDWFPQQLATYHSLVRCSGGDVAASIATLAEATYIATMHPAVGLALADWLEESAPSIETVQAHAPDDWRHSCLVIADLILGGAQ